MKKQIMKTIVGFVFTGLALGLFVLTGCTTTRAGGSADTGAGGAQLWSQNCQRCHNSPDPGSLSDSQWEVAVHQMRVRANLTATEHQKIVQFLKAGN